MSVKHILDRPVSVLILCSLLFSSLLQTVHGQDDQGVLLPIVSSTGVPEDTLRGEELSGSLQQEPFDEPVPFVGGVSIQSGGAFFPFSDYASALLPGLAESQSSTHPLAPAKRTHYAATQKTDRSYTDKEMSVWNALLLVFLSIDTDYTDSSGIPQHLTYTLSQNELSDGLNAFRRFVPIAHDFSNGEAFVHYDIMYVNRPLASLTPGGTNLWWPSPNDTREEIDRYAPSGKYDSVFVFWPQNNPETGQGIPSMGWGLSLPATWWSNDATYATVTNAPTWWWDGPPDGGVWLHEWLHGVCAHYAELGYAIPEQDADGAASHGYTWSPISGWSQFYRDLMTGNVLEDGCRTGVTADAWRTGAITGESAHVFVDYFRSDTLADYDRSGAWTWNSVGENVMIDGQPASDNRLHAPVTFDQSFLATGRAYIPDNGIGPFDSISLAVRGSRIEYWGIIFFGTNLEERGNISISRNDIGGELFPIRIAAGWHTLKMQVDVEFQSIRFKVWADGSDEPDWQTSLSLDPGWTANGIGYRHYGDSTVWVDDVEVVGTTAPASPILVSPDDGAQIDTGTPALVWNTVAKADRYRIHIDNDADFSSIVVNDTTSNTSYTSTSLPDGDYYWRVRAQDRAGNWSTWSDVWRFTVRPSGGGQKLWLSILFG